MPVEVAVPQSPGWWLQRLAKRLLDPIRLQRLDLLEAYFTGNPPLPVGVEAARDAYVAFHRHARSNFAELIVSAARERMIPRGLRTSADGDETGDREAWRIWQRAGLSVEAADVHELMLTFGEAFVIVGAVDPDTKVPIITAEDPRQVVAATDPAQPRRVVAALKIFDDDIDGVEYAYLYLPGEVHVAARPRRSDYPMVSGIQMRLVGFEPREWDWVPERSGAIPGGQMPVVRFVNKRGVGEFETHTDLLNRINHQILQRMVIATMQAFRQRAIKGLADVYPPGHPLAGQQIDYTNVFAADPAAIWQLPETAEMWESGQVDLTPILSAVKDDVAHLGVVTRTPFSMLMPEGANQSAEGASLQREGLVFKVEDRIERVNAAWAQVMSLAFRALGDDARADLDALTVLWQSPQRLSLAERADAASKATDMPWRAKMRLIWDIPPDEIDRLEAERAADQALAAAFAEPRFTVSDRTSFAAKTPQQLTAAEGAAPSATPPGQGAGTSGAVAG